MQKNKIISYVVVALVVVAIIFYAGMKYGQSKSSTPTGTNFSQRAGGQFGSSTARGNRGAFGGSISGQILSADANTLTITDQTGGSRIVFLSASTTVSHMTLGTVKDLTVGTNVSVNGATNSDNSINAQMIQIRPAGPSPVQPK